MKVRIGTSGFQYPEWKGKFYPADLSAAKMLPFYARHFSTTEINYSFRRIPSEKAMNNWSKLTPPEFVFALKAPQKITHFAKLRNCREATEFFLQSISALGLQRGPVLFQLPPNLQKDISLLEDFLGGLGQDARLAFEFRHASWFGDDVYAVLRKANAALCIAENEDLETPFAATADFGYLRLRREDYTNSVLTSRARQIESQEGRWSEVFIYFKHEEMGVGPKFAAIMKSILPTNHAS